MEGPGVSMPHCHKRVQGLGLRCAGFGCCHGRPAAEHNTGECSCMSTMYVFLRAPHYMLDHAWRVPVASFSAGRGLIRCGVVKCGLSDSRNLVVEHDVGWMKSGEGTGPCAGSFLISDTHVTGANSRCTSTCKAGPYAVLFEAEFVPVRRLFAVLFKPSEAKSFPVSAILASRSKYGSRRSLGIHV